MTKKEFRRLLKAELMRPQNWGLSVCGQSANGIYHLKRGLDLRVMIEAAPYHPSPPARVYTDYMETFITTIARRPAQWCLDAVARRYGEYSCGKREEFAEQRRSRFLNSFEGF